MDIQVSLTYRTFHFLLHTFKSPRIRKCRKAFAKSSKFYKVLMQKYNQTKNQFIFNFVNPHFEMFPMAWQTTIKEKQAYFSIYRLDRWKKHTLNWNSFLMLLTTSRQKKRWSYFNTLFGIFPNTTLLNEKT